MLALKRFLFLCSISIFSLSNDGYAFIQSGDFFDNVSVNASWLYWKVNGDDFDYVVEKTTRNNQQSVISEPSGIAGIAHANAFDFENFEPNESESIHDLKFNWDSGVRLGIGFCPCRTDWGIQLDWTHFHSKSNKHLDVLASGGDIIGVGFPVVDDVFSTIALTPGGVARFSSSLNFQYDVVDLELGRWCLDCGCCATFRPHIGFRFAQIQEKFKDQFLLNESISILGVLNSVDFKSPFSTKNRFQGAGIRAGFDFDLCLCKGLSFIGRGAASLIWGNTKIKNKYAVDFLVQQGTGELILDYASEIKEHYHQTRAITDLSIGLRYQFCACDCYPVTLEAAWEHHLIFGQHRFFVDDSLVTGNPAIIPGETIIIPVIPTATTSWKNKGTLAVQGLTLTGGIQF